MTLATTATFQPQPPRAVHSDDVRTALRCAEKITYLLEAADALRAHVAPDGDALARRALADALRGESDSAAGVRVRAALAEHYERGLRFVRAAIRFPKGAARVASFDSRAWYVTCAVLSALEAARAEEGSDRAAHVACVRHAVGVLGRGEGALALIGVVS